MDRITKRILNFFTDLQPLDDFVLLTDQPLDDYVLRTDRALASAYTSTHVYTHKTHIHIHPGMRRANQTQFCALIMVKLHGPASAPSQSCICRWTVRARADKFKGEFEATKFHNIPQLLVPSFSTHVLQLSILFFQLIDALLVWHSAQ